MLKKLINSVINTALDKLFASDSCLLCKRQAKLQHFVCTDCYVSLPWLSVNKCEECDLPLIDAKLCAQYMKQPYTFNKLSAAFDYRPPICQWIHKLKFSEKLYAAKVLATWMMQRCILHHEVDCLVAVPLHPSRQRQRGFNQTWELAKEISKLTNIEAVAHGYQRINATVPQMSLAYQARQRNVSSLSFDISVMFKNKNVLIVEDVVTTGATVNALAQAFKRAGAQTVQVWACCRTGIKQSN